MGNITALGASDMSDLQTLNTNIANFSSTTNLATITLTDNGGSGTEVDFGTLADIVDNSQTNFKGTVTFAFQAGDTIDIDNSIKHPQKCQIIVLFCLTTFKASFSLPGMDW
jgi:hypothetical protein